MRQNQRANGGTTPDPNAQGNSEGEQRRDPLRDRPNQGYASDESNVEIPAESDLQRARRIFDELRKRYGDRSRTDLELDYIERLLKRFRTRCGTGPGGNSHTKNGSAHHSTP